MQGVVLRIVREKERERKKEEPGQRKRMILPACPVGTNAKPKVMAEADSAVSFMLLLTLLFNFDVS